VATGYDFANRARFMIRASAPYKKLRRRHMDRARMLRRSELRIVSEMVFPDQDIRIPAGGVGDRTSLAPHRQQYPRRRRDAANRCCHGPVAVRH
jgi:hypothetical protein